MVLSRLLLPENTRNRRDEEDHPVRKRRAILINALKYLAETKRDTVTRFSFPLYFAVFQCGIDTKVACIYSMKAGTG